MKLDHGRSFTASYYPPQGAADNPMSEAELSAKFGECMAWGGIGLDKVARAKDMLLGLERLRSVQELMQTLVTGRR